MGGLDRASKACEPRLRPKANIAAKEIQNIEVPPVQKKILKRAACTKCEFA